MEGSSADGRISLQVILIGSGGVILDRYFSLLSSFWGWEEVRGGGGREGGKKRISLSLSSEIESMGANETIPPAGRPL